LTLSFAILQEAVRAMRKEQKHQLGAEGFVCKNSWIKTLWITHLDKQGVIQKRCA
jgi:hypothetical protein